MTPGPLLCPLTRRRDVLALESREGTRASRRVEEGLSISFSGGGVERPEDTSLLVGA